MTYKPRFRPGKNTKCWCGSGRKTKNCHGLSAGPSVAKAVPVRVPISQPPPSNPPMAVSEKPWGMPSEEHQLWVVPLKAGEQPPKDLVGKPGKYKIQLLLMRPGYPIMTEHEFKFIDDVVGDSHVAVTKPLKERRLEDAVQVLL
jgi:hypothetical protein